MAVETQRGSGGTLAFVMIFFFKCGPGHAGGPVARRILALEPCWNHAGTIVEPCWNRLQFCWNRGLLTVWRYVFLYILHVWDPDRLVPI